MFFNEPGEASNSKRIVYLTASTILGILLGVIAASLIEMKYLSLASNPFNDGYTRLQILQGIILILGAICGFFVGKFWWRKIYVERVWIKR
jgi:uncharacterized membrane protein YoaK (UPF0700 family)